MKTEPIAPGESAFAELLAEERAALLSLDWTRLQDLLPRKRAALEDLVGAPHTASPALLEDARRNTALLDATAAGLRAALDRLREVRAASMGQTYRADGSRHSHRGPGRSYRA